MPDVQFEDNNFQDPRMQTTLSGKQSSMVKLLMRTGLVKDVKTANYVLIAISIVAFILTLFVLFS